MNLPLLATLAWLALVVAIMVYVDRDMRRDAPPRRYAIGFRSNALARPARRWRWQLVASPVRRDEDALDVVVELALVGPGCVGYRTHGWARTYLGASIAAHRARHRLEVALDRHRRELEELVAFHDTEAAS